MKYEELVKSLKDACEGADASSVKEHIAIQFNVTGEAQGAFYLEIADGKVCIEPYEYYDRDVLVTIPEENLIAIFEGKLDFVDAFNEGKLQAEGNLGKALVLKDVIEKNLGKKKSVAAKAKSVVSAAKAVKKVAATKKTATTKKADSAKKTTTTKKTATKKEATTK